MGGPVVTEAEKAEIWDRRCKGESLSAIARHLDRGLETIRRLVLLTGGVRPRPRTRSRRDLTLVEREEISRGLAAAMASALLGMPSAARWSGLQGGAEARRLEDRFLDPDEGIRVLDGDRAVETLAA